MSTAIERQIETIAEDVAALRHQFDAQREASATALAYVRLAGDPQAAQERLDAIMAAVDKLEAAKQEINAARTAAAEDAAEKLAALERRGAEITRRHTFLEESERKFAEKNAGLFAALEEIRNLSNAMKRAVITFSVPHFDERVNKLPSWEQLAEDYGKPVDAHFDDAEDVQAVAPAALARASRSNRSMRRV